MDDLHFQDQKRFERSAESALLTDLYQLTMLQAYRAAGMRETAVFEFFVRKLPRCRKFLVAAGLEQVLDFLEGFHFTAAEIDWLKTIGRFDGGFLESLREFRFTGDVHAMPEGTIFFQHEPILRVTAPLSEAQIVETRIVNLLQFQTLIASKAARCALAAPGKALVDFGLRRAHGSEAGLLSARASYIGGFSATSDVLAGQRFGIPISGTMAHSLIQACVSEDEAFLLFARANPKDVVLLIDTYDTEAAASIVARLAPRMAAEGTPVQAVRLDSGDLGAHAHKVRAILDSAGLRDTRIVASGSLDENELARLSQSAAPIDGYGIGSRVFTSADAPYLDCAYKLQEYAGQPRLKLSEAKATWPGRKQVFRNFDLNGRASGDVVTCEGENHSGKPLLQLVMRGGRRVGSRSELSAIRECARTQVNRMPESLRDLEEGSAPYTVEISDSLRALATHLTEEIRARMHA